MVRLKETEERDGVPPLLALMHQFKSVGSQGHVFVKFMNTYHFGSAIRAYASWKTTTKAQVKKDICSTLQMI